MKLLLEAYQDRVQQVADEVMRHYHNQPVTKDQLRTSIQARMYGIPLGSVKPKEFVKDVLDHLAGRLNISKQTSAGVQQMTDLVSRMTSYAESRLGEMALEGDPADLHYYVYRRFMREIQQLLYSHFDKLTYTHTPESWFDHTLWPKCVALFRKQNQGKDFQDVAADMYDSHVGDLAYDAAHKGENVEEYLRRHGVSVHNPHRKG